MEILLPSHNHSPLLQGKGLLESYTGPGVRQVYLTLWAAWVGRYQSLIK